MKKHLLTFFLVGAFLLGLSLPSSTHAQMLTDWTDENKCTNSGVATIQGLECLIANVLTIAITAIGLAGFVMLLIGSFRYMLSGGNTKGTEDARKTITFAAVGLVVALSAIIILNLISAFTGIEVIKTFVIPSSDRGL